MCCPTLVPRTEHSNVPVVATMDLPGSTMIS